MQAGHYRNVPVEKIVWGTPAAEAVAAEAESRKAARVFVVASGTLSRSTPEVGKIRSALGSRFAGLFDTPREHTPIDSAIACATAARGASADLLVTVGGGSPIDTVKIVQLCLTNGIEDIEALRAVAGKLHSKPSVIRQVAVPTTLSGGEYSSVAGGTDPARKMKDSYLAPDLCAQTIVLDPALCLHTPERLWLSTAIRAVDHAVEGYCAPATNALVQATALHALKLFAGSLPCTKEAPSDLEARYRSQMGVWLAAQSLGRVSMGASHGIGYLLGTMCGVPHGYTSCVMLPAVLAWSAPAAKQAQADIARALGHPDETAAQAVTRLVASLELPQRLSDVGVGRDRFAEIAERAMRHPVVRANCRPIREAADVMEILELAA
ncbi:MAG: iron-containing alcohol dehydrogenase [Alphaproteobacteria bacterium]|nr:iron-containing alcohol dehydrogenase [Alphaproteobacteria bacterium]